jgi:four helix bundle protein
MAESYRDVIAWQKGMSLVTEVYRVSQSFPQREMYGLAQQVRRAAVSVLSNIAEGKRRQTKPDYVQFLYRARGTVLEVQTQLEIARNLEFIDQSAFEIAVATANETGRVLNGLITDVERQIGLLRANS